MAIERSLIPRFRSEMVRFAGDLLDKRAQGAADIAISDHSARVADLLRRAYTASIDQTASRLQRRKSGGRYIERKQVDSVVDAIRRKWILEFALDKSSTIATNSLGIARRMLADIAQEGIGEAEAARRFRKQFGDISRSRARTIARTETHAASQDASLNIARELSEGAPVLNEWVAIEDGRTRESHREASGDMVGMDDSFSVGGALLRHPGDPGGPAAEIINCRCVLVYEEP